MGSLSLSLHLTSPARNTMAALAHKLLTNRWSNCVDDGDGVDDNDLSKSRNGNCNRSNTKLY